MNKQLTKDKSANRLSNNALKKLTIAEVDNIVGCHSYVNKDG